MYFIPRNNVVYNYIAHINKKRRYSVTLFVFIAMIILGFYGIYKPLIAHITLFKIERTRLQTQYEDIEQLKKTNKELSTHIQASKKNISEQVIADDKKEEYCNSRLQFIFDTITQLGLALNSYGSCKEQDKKWYVKNSAHYQMTGPLEKILSFLKTTKDSNQMITFSHLAITHVKESTFQLSCDVGIVAVKK